MLLKKIRKQGKNYLCKRNCYGQLINNCESFGNPAFFCVGIIIMGLLKHKVTKKAHKIKTEVIK
jgi:hypothetical protein